MALPSGPFGGTKDAVSIIDEIREAASHWPSLADECDVPKKITEVIVSNFQIS